MYPKFQNQDIKPAFLKAQFQQHNQENQFRLDESRHDFMEDLSDSDINNSFSSDTEVETGVDNLPGPLSDSDTDCRLPQEEVYNFQQGYADFLNRLLTFHYVPLSLIGKKE